MMAKTRSERNLLDLAMTILLILLMTYSLLGERAHEWLGIALLLLLVLHQSWNIGWWRRLFSGRYTLCRALRTALTVLLFMSLLGSMTSGVLLSQYVLDGFPLRSGGELAQAVHLPCAYWSFCLTGLHLGLHWSTILAAARKAPFFRNPARVRKIVLNLLGSAVALYGIAAFFRRDLPMYLFFRTHFVFFDFSEPIPFFYLDYLAIMGLCIFLSHTAAKLLRKRRSRKS